MKRSDALLKRRVRRSYAVSTVSIALVLFLLGTVGYVMMSVLRAAIGMRESVTMIVELKDGLGEEMRDSIGSALAGSDMVAAVRFVSKEDKLADEGFRQAFDVDIEGIMGENPLPDTFDVTLSARSSDVQALESFVEESSAIEGVERVTYPRMFLEKMHSVLDTMQIILLLFGGTMLVISLVLLNNTIRLVIISKRNIINTMKLVGATRWFIMKPFLGASALQGLCAGVLATALRRALRPQRQLPRDRHNGTAARNRHDCRGDGRRRHNSGRALHAVRGEQVRKHEIKQDIPLLI